MTISRTLLVVLLITIKQGVDTSLLAFETSTSSVLSTQSSVGYVDLPTELLVRCWKEVVKNEPVLNFLRTIVLLSGLDKFHRGVSGSEFFFEELLKSTLAFKELNTQGNTILKNYLKSTVCQVNLTKAEQEFLKRICIALRQNDLDCFKKMASMGGIKELILFWEFRQNKDQAVTDNTHQRGTKWHIYQNDCICYISSSLYRLVNTQNLNQKKSILGEIIHKLGPKYDRLTRILITPPGRELDELIEREEEIESENSPFISNQPGHPFARYVPSYTN